MATINLPDHTLRTAREQATLTGITIEQWITHAINAHARPDNTDYLMDDMGFPSHYRTTITDNGAIQIIPVEPDEHTTTHTITAQGR